MSLNKEKRVAILSNAYNKPREEKSNQEMQLVSLNEEKS